MSIKQISVFLENKTGALGEMTNALAEAGINLRALSIAESTDFGIVRIITDDTFRATTVLKEAGFITTITPVLAYIIPDEAGGLSKLLKIFTEAGIDIEYMYSSVATGASSEAYMIFRTKDVEAAEAALAGKGLKALTQENL